MQYLVTLTLLASLAGAILVLVAGRTQRSAKWIALVASLVPLALSAYALVAVGWEASSPGSAPIATEGFACADGARAPEGYAFAECYAWIPGLGAHVILGLDGISAPMFFLTALL